MHVYVLCTAALGRSRLVVILGAFAILRASAVLAQQPGPDVAAQVSAPHPPSVVRRGVANPAVARRLTDLHPVAVFPVEGTPDWSVVAANSVWVSSAKVNHVVQLDAATNKPGLVADVRRPCSGLAQGFGSIWIPSCGDKAIVRLDPTTAKSVATIAIEPEDSEGGITIGAGSVWIVAKPGRLVRIDPATNSVAGSVELPSGAANPAWGGGFLWITSNAQSELLKVDPQALKIVVTIPVGPRPRFLTVSPDSVWTLNQGDGSVSRVNMDSGQLLATIPCGISGEGGEISFGDGFVWATMFDFPLTQIDPTSNLVVRQWSGKGGDGLRTGLGSLWLSNLLQSTVWRISSQLE